MSRIEDQICEAIEVIVNKSISDAGFDRTIQGTIKRCDNAATGKYVVQYQDSLIYAYAASPDTTYSDGVQVFVLVPENDMTKTKTILGLVSSLGIDYGDSVDDDERYEIVGNNCANLGECDLSSYRNHNTPPGNPIKYEKVLYDANSGINEGGIDSKALKMYLEEASAIVCAANFRTSLAAEQQYSGDYGIQFDLEFANESTGETVVQSLVINIDNMVGDPYRLTLGKRQWAMFSIDTANFIKVKSVSVFTRDFAHHKPDAELTQEDNDIFITNIELFAANELSEDALNGVYMNILTPRGTFFPSNALATAFLTLQSQIKVKGRIIDPDVNNLQFYWFRQNVSIVPKSLRYHKCGGRAWECLNDYNIIEEATDTTAAQVEWVPYKDTWTVNFTDATAHDTVYKCVCLYDGTLLKKEITVINMACTQTLRIESDLGTKFYYDIGRPNLTCVTNDSDHNADPRYSYYWAIEDVDGNIVPIPEDTPQNKVDYLEYINTSNALQQLQNDITAGRKMANAFANELRDKQVAFDNAKDKQFVSYNNNQRIGADGIITYDAKFDIFGNKVYNVNVGLINSFSKFICSVFSRESGSEVFLGTASITLTNTDETEDMYTLVINNGTQTFQYDEYGISPASPAKDNPIEIPILTFTLYDNLGNRIEEDVIRRCAFAWRVPTKSTMLLIQNTDATEESIGANLNYRIYKQALFLDYAIANKYSYSNTDNEIQLTVNYKGMVLKAHTNLTFVKQGENGTNGSIYTARIVPNSTSTNLPAYPTFTYVKGSASGHFNFGPKNGSNNYVLTTSANQQPFKIQLFKSDEMIFDSSTATKLTDTSYKIIDEITGANITITTEWSMLRNIYNKNFEDISDFIMTSSGYMAFQKQTLRSNVPPANIVKCVITYNDGSSNSMGERRSIYASLPVITVEQYNIDVALELKQNAGFRYVEYTMDGVNPQYDNSNPFELVVTQTINGIGEDVSRVQGQYAVGYKWSLRSSVFDFGARKLTESNELQMLARSGDYNGQCYYKPVSNYNGLCVTNAVVCEVNRGSTNILGYIYIPIHFYRNRYGLAELNAWDGNSIQVDNEGGFILAPEIGAGRKEVDNSFTGAMMGVVQQPQRTTADVGVLGFNHGERTFLLDAEDGSAQFGAHSGKIFIDPSQERALIYSNDFFKNYDEKGKPTSYDYRNDNYRQSGNGTGKGMLIDLTTPEMFWGNGTFYVTADGYMHARTGGDIGGWGIDDHAIFSLDEKDVDPNNLEKRHQAARTGMNSVYNPQVGNGNGSNTLTVPVPNNYQGINPKALAFWAGKTGGAGASETAHKYYVTHDGYLRVREATIGAGTDSNLIYIGKSEQTDENNAVSALYTMNKSYKNAKMQGFYIGTDGFGLGNTQTVTYYRGKARDVSVTLDEKNGDKEKYEYVDNSDEQKKNEETIETADVVTGKTVSRFQVDKDGTFYAREGYIGTGTNGWYIGSSYIRNGNKTTYMDGNYGGVFLGTNGIGLGSDSTGISPFYVSNSGYLHSKKGMIANWVISDYSLRTAGAQYDGSIFSTGDDRLTNGTAAVQIPWDSNAFSKGDMYIGQNGLRLGSAFAVDTKGNMRANSGLIGGWQITNSAIRAVNGTGSGRTYLTLNSDGSIYNGSSPQDGDWYILANGQASFSRVIINGKDAITDVQFNNGSIGGAALSGCGFSGGTISGAGISGGTIAGKAYRWETVMKYISDFTIDLTNKKATISYKGIQGLVTGSEIDGNQTANITGILPVANGGTGRSSAGSGYILTGSGGDSALQAIQILPVSHGGTGRSELTNHSVLVGNGTNAITMIGNAATTGAFYKDYNADPAFGTLVIGYGGTNATSAANARNTLSAASNSHAHTVSLKWGHTHSITEGSSQTGGVTNYSSISPSVTSGPPA